MKKLLLPAIIGVTLLGGYASANTGEVQFIGAVTSETCDIDTEIGGLVKSTIDLGKMTTADTHGDYVDFELVPRTDECLKKTSGQVGWQSAGFTNTGLANMKGTANGVSIQLTAVNSTIPNQDVTYNSQSVDFGNGTDAIGNMKFKARMAATTGQTLKEGTVISSATYAVAYK
ncbi:MULTISPECIES: fimbrial protein [Providencia]|uniref:fimbrial protein n=1 Tax=Providencia TaxID=586 RepID=UPI0018E42BCE|nr:MULTISPECIES: fimbrial protein [Providencia]MBI6203599.1 fimbrial protein [Providencia rettgeri]UEK61688.1 fimbrial protein [Providencia rettgeri]